MWYCVWDHSDFKHKERTKNRILRKDKKLCWYAVEKNSSVIDKYMFYLKQCVTLTSTFVH